MKIFYLSTFGLGLAFIFIVSAYFLDLLLPGDPLLGYDEAEKPESSFAWWLGLATIVGILSNGVVAALRQMPANRPVQLVNLGNSLLFPGTLIAMFISPLVFFVTLEGLQGQPDTMLAVLAAYQNGFFWDSVLKSREIRVE